MRPHSIILLQLCCGIAAAQSWDPLSTISTTYTQILSPVSFDAANNAWVEIADFQGNAALAQSTGTSGAWQPPVLVPGASSVIMVVTPASVVHLIRQAPNGSNTDIAWNRYIPGTGFTTPQVLYSDPPGVLPRADAVLDASGNLVMVFEGPGSTDSLPHAWSMVYTAATGTWGAAREISPPGQDAWAVTLGRSADGNHILLLYESIYNVPYGLYSQEYLAGSQTWAAPKQVPGTVHAADAAGGRLPFALDNAGNATLITPLSSVQRFPGQFPLMALYGFRYEGGKWGPGTQLSNWSRTTVVGPVPIINSSGVVLAPAFISSDPSGVTVGVYRFTPGQGWQTEAKLQATSFAGNLAVAWFGSSGQAVLVYVVIVDNSTEQLVSVMNTNGIWSSLVPVAMPGGFIHQVSLGTAPTGQVVAVLDYGPNGGANVATAATWLRP
ncbi:MAG: hypothetical protein C5B51_15725 [Terriglobia bacterium]|nr:MAG: hypothetical protein C5B51_15725 [Terriglobia bacterium]